jgi:hypothetical protein
MGTNGEAFLRLTTRILISNTTKHKEYKKLKILHRRVDTESISITYNHCGQDNATESNNL